MGLNLKCASCHDSFISDWKLEDSYGLGFCKSEEQIEILYRALTGRELYEE